MPSMSLMYKAETHRGLTLSEKVMFEPLLMACEIIGSNIQSIEYLWHKRRTHEAVVLVLASAAGDGQI